MLSAAKAQQSPAMLVVSLLLLVLCALLIWFSGRAGFASLLYTYAATANQLAAADAAVKLSGGDPEAHTIRGGVLEAGGDLKGAIAEYSKAVARRPDDYVLWLNLARARELEGQPLPAIAAAREATRLAPYYAQPHWQLGNLLIRAGQSAPGFAELGLAANTDAKLWPAIIDLAWQLSGGNAQLVAQTLAPKTSAAQQALAAYFRKRGKVTEAIALYAAAGKDADPERRQFLSELVAAKRFNDAYALWLLSHPGNAANAVGVMVDPGFEQQSDLDEPGFGWRSPNKTEALLLTLEVAQPRTGRASLSVEFSGNAGSDAPIISQLVLAAPQTHYRLNFAARTENLISGGLPRVLVLDASSNQILGTVGLPPNGAWQDYALDFKTTAETTAIEIRLARDSCNKTPCPIFGRLWLDMFSLAVPPTARCQMSDARC